MPKRIPIAALKRFCREHGLSMAVLLAHDGTQDHVVAYGRSIEEAGRAADMGNNLKTVLGWPEALHAQPSRVRRLQALVEEQRRQLDKCVAELEKHQAFLKKL